jgi:serine/threonine protein kinase
LSFAREEELMSQPLEPSGDIFDDLGKLFAEPGLDVHAGEVLAGAFELVEPIGEGGGMGVVWRARDVEGRRPVAVKFISTVLLNRKARERFRLEYEVGARLEHPNIARPLLAGCTATAIPFIVMEHVDGPCITDFCDAQRYGLEPRLALYRQLLDAVIHAHDRGVIHRDIKPSNVLVASGLGDADAAAGKTPAAPVVKLIDFGIAKDLLRSARGAIGANTAITSTSDPAPKTEEFAATEQFAGGTETVRTDVFALGMLLYLLLAGKHPYALDDQSPESYYAELSRLADAAEPVPPPSVRLSRLSAGELNEIAARRGISGRQLLRTFDERRGELAWIIRKATEKRASERYESVAALRDDLERVAQHLPPLASPPSRRYQLRKFVRRHRLGVSIAASMILLLVAGAAGTSVGLVKAERQRSEAERARAAAMEVNALLKQVLKAPNPDVAQGQPLVALDLLTRASRQLDAGRSLPPTIESELRMTVGDGFQALASYDEASHEYARATDLRRRSLGPDDRLTLASMTSSGAVLVAQGELVEAETLLDEVRERATRRFGEADEVTLEATTNLAAAYEAQGNAKALELLRRVAELRAAALGSDDERTLTARNGLAAALDRSGRIDEATTIWRDVLAGCERTLGPNHPKTLSTLGNVAYALSMRDKLAEAAPYIDEALRRRTLVFGPEHPDTLLSMSDKVQVLVSQHRAAEALELIDRAWQVARTKLPKSNFVYQATLHNRGDVLDQLKRYAEAEEALRQVYEVRLSLLGSAHFDTIISQEKLAEVLMHSGRADEAETLLRDGLAASRRALGAAHPLTRDAAGALIGLLGRTGRQREADVLSAEFAAPAAATRPTSRQAGISS